VSDRLNERRATRPYAGQWPPTAYRQSSGMTRRSELARFGPRMTGPGADGSGDMIWTHVVRVMSVRRVSRPLHPASGDCAARYLHRLGLRCHLSGLGESVEIRPRGVDPLEGDASVWDGHGDPLVFVPEGDRLHLSVHPAAVGFRLRDLGQRGAPAVEPPDAVGLLRVHAGRHLRAHQA
jgi:hypothetical protein